MSEADRVRWDERYVCQGPPPPDAIGLDPVFLPCQDTFPTAGRVLDIACGQGAGSVWFASRGLDVQGFDVSGVAVGQARKLAEHTGVADHCRFDVADLDRGLPPGPTVDVVYCRRFRDRRLDQPMIDRLTPGGLLAITALSAAGGHGGPYRAAPGELRAAFAALEVIEADEGRGQAWLLARRPAG